MNPLDRQHTEESEQPSHDSLLPLILKFPSFARAREADCSTSLTPPPSSPELLHRNMTVSTADATSYGVMVGAGETFIPAFALAVGLGEVTAGLVASMPLLAGGLLQLATPALLARLKNQQLWVVGTAAVQGLAFIPLIIAAWFGSVSGWGLMLIASIYWAAGLSTGPAWNSWIELMIPKRVRASYFSRRTRASQVATFLGFMGGGALLQAGRAGDWLNVAFAILFSVACAARMISVLMLASHQLPRRRRTHATPNKIATPTDLSGRNLLIYLVIVQGMVQISGPYFTPYMLKEMGLSYLTYTSLVAVAFFAKIISLAAWGKVAKERGAMWLLTVGGIAIVPLSLLWTVSQRLEWLILIQTINGICWAAYELGFFLMFFEALPAERRVKMLTYYNLANTAAWCAGSTVGAIVLSTMGASLQGYYTLFMLSCAGRLIAVCYLLSHRPNFTVRVTQIGLRILGVRPSGVPLDSPILPSIPNQEPEKTSQADSASSAA